MIEHFLKTLEGKASLWKGKRLQNIRSGWRPAASFHALVREWGRTYGRYDSNVRHVGCINITLSSSLWRRHFTIQETIRKSTQAVELQRPSLGISCARRQTFIGGHGETLSSGS